MRISDAQAGQGLVRCQWQQLFVRPAVLAAWLSTPAVHSLASLDLVSWASLPPARATGGSNENSR
jgi:hypothetical protein